MPTTAADLMTRAVVSVGPDTPLLEVYRLFVSEQIHGAPVMDEEERLIGVISSSDLLRTRSTGRGPGRAC
jgi:CBS domain-containing protein